MPESLTYFEKQQHALRSAADQARPVIERVITHAPDPSNFEEYLLWLYERELLDPYLGIDSKKAFGPRSLPRRRLMRNPATLQEKFHEAMMYYTVAARIYQESNGERISINEVAVDTLTRNLDALYYAEDPLHRNNRSASRRIWTPDGVVVRYSDGVVDEVQEHTFEEGFKYPVGKVNKMRHGKRNYGTAFMSELSVKFGVPKSSHLPVDPSLLHIAAYTRAELSTGSTRTVRAMKQDIETRGYATYPHIPRRIA